MPFPGIIELDAVEKLAKVLHAHCALHGIISAAGRESVAASLIKFYRRGITDDLALADLLEREDSSEVLIADRGRVPQR